MSGTIDKLLRFAQTGKPPDTITNGTLGVLDGAIRRISHTLGPVPVKLNDGEDFIERFPLFDFVSLIWMSLRFYIG